MKLPELALFEDVNIGDMVYVKDHIDNIFQYDLKSKILSESNNKSS